MCGIFGCISSDASDKVLEGLRKLEYRGYDSAGLAAIFPKHTGPVETERTTGYVSDLVSKANGRFKGSIISIGHTRWATHGRVNDTNAHPHSNEDGTIALVHNGIIENAPELLERVVNLGYNVTSETDSEVVVHLLDHELKTQSSTNSPLDAFSSVIGMLRGSWAIAVVMTGLDGILVSKKGAPLIVGKGHNSLFISSDVQPFYGCCSEYAHLNDGETFHLSKKTLENLESRLVMDFSPLIGEYEEQDHGSFDSMMEKEIHDQKISLTNVLGGRIFSDGKGTELAGIDLNAEEIENLERINIVACGSAFYASELGARYIRKMTDITVESFRASEFPADDVCNANTLTIGVSQSGETKDTLDALHRAKVCGGKVTSFCNVIGSTMSRLANNGAYLHAGPEYAVASTKAFTNMIALFVLFAIDIAPKTGELEREIIPELRKLPGIVSKQLLEDDGSVNKAVNLISNAKTAVFIGRGVSAPLTQEGALKMMEVAYLPCVAYPGGELKHGPIALIEKGTPVIAIAPEDETISLMESSIRECKSRGAKIILISDSDGPITGLSDVLIQTQTTHSELSPIVCSIPLQMLALRLGQEKGFNVDRPRNLAKSVTVV